MTVQRLPSISHEYCSPNALALISEISKTLFPNGKVVFFLKSRLPLSCFLYIAEDFFVVLIKQNASYSPSFPEYLMVSCL